MIGAERQMIGGDGRLHGGEDVDLALPADLENGAAAVADVQKIVLIEGDASGDAHAFHIHREIARRRDLIDKSLMAAGGVKDAVRIPWRGPLAFISRKPRASRDDANDLIDRDGGLLPGDPLKVV